MSSAEHYKRKKRRERFKKIGLNVLIWLVIISFVGSIGFGSFRSAVNYPKVMKINGKTYRYKSGSAFNYILSQNERQNGERYKGKVSPKAIHSFSVDQSIQNLLSMGLLYDFAKKKGNIRPSKKAVQNMMRYIVGGRLPNNPQDGFITFVEMEYVRGALSGQSGDILNAISPVNTAELFSYFDLINYSAQAEVAWLDITNYLKTRIADKQLSSYYQKNLKTYTTEVFVQDLTVKSKQKSVAILKYVQENGWDAAVKLYATNKIVEYFPEVNLTSSGDTAKRFELVNGIQVGDSPATAPFENRAYHVMKVKKYASFDQLDASVQDVLRRDYLSTNYQQLERDAQKDLEQIADRLSKMTKAKQSLKYVAKSLGLKYALTARLSPVDQRIRDAVGTTLDLPLLAEENYREYLFRGVPGTVSKVFQSPSRLLVMKLKKRGFNEKQNYAEGIDRQVYLRYNAFKTRAVSQDWIENLKKNSKYQIFKTDIKKIYEL